jgi:hypothetical protein
MESKIDTTKKNIDHMRDLGEDTSIARPVDFLFVGDSVNLSFVETELEKKGFKRIPSNYPEPEKSLLVSKILEVDLLLTTDIISEMESLAKQNSVVFDGWETIPAKKSNGNW